MTTVVTDQTATATTTTSTATNVVPATTVTALQTTSTQTVLTTTSTATVTVVDTTVTTTTTDVTVTKLATLTSTTVTVPVSTVTVASTTGTTTVFTTGTTVFVTATYSTTNVVVATATATTKCANALPTFAIKLASSGAYNGQYLYSVPAVSVTGDLSQPALTLSANRLSSYTLNGTQLQEYNGQLLSGGLLAIFEYAYFRTPAQQTANLQNSMTCAIANGALSCSYGLSSAPLICTDGAYNVLTFSNGLLSAIPAGITCTAVTLQVVPLCSVT